MIRGDAAEAALLARAKDLAARRGIAGEGDLEPLFDMAHAAEDHAALVRLRQIHETAGWILVESTLADVPADLRWLYESGAVTLEQLALIHQQLGVTTASDVAAAMREGRLRSIPGVGADTEAAIAQALPTVRARIPRIPLGRAFGIAEPLLAAARAMPHVRWAETAGSLRRGEDLVGDIELVVSSDRPTEAIADLLAPLEVARWLHRSERRAYALVDRIQLGVRVVEPANAGATLLHLTGSAAHLDALRAYASERGWRLTSRGLHTPEGTAYPASVEVEIYEALRLPPIPPEVRRAGDEVAVAAERGLPRLLARGDIRGDLHMHTHWSDGRDSIEAMATACRALGYEYLAITDHSPHSAASRNLTVDAVSRQADEIAAVRERCPELAILHGCEVDILGDGTLDFPDWILERFDIVLASLHEREGHGPERLLERYVAAMRHPMVAMITHPTNRLVPNRPGYELDYERLFEAAVETGTIVEIDGAPAHLDLDGDLARQAVAAGAMLCVDSDCHRAELLERQMGLGILMARRGWIEPRHVLNTRPLDEVRRAISAKRDR